MNAGELTSANEVEILIKEDLANFKRNQVIFEHPTTDFIPATIADHGKSLLKTSGEKLADDQSGAIVEDQSVTHYRNRSCATNYSSFTVSDYFVAPPPPSSFPFENLVIPKKQTETFPKVDNAEPVTFSEVYSDMHISSHSEMSDYKPNQDLPNNHQLSATETFTLSMEEVNLNLIQLKRSSPSPFSSPARSRNASIVETLKKNLTRNPSISPKSSSSLDDTNSIREIFLNRFGATKPNTVEKGSSASSLDPSHRQSEELVTRLDFVPKTKKVQMTLSELISKTFSKLHIPWNRDRNRNRDSKSFVSLTGSLPRFGSEREVKRSASVPEMSPERSVVETLTKRLSTMSSQSGMVDMDEATQSGWLHVKKYGKGDWHKRYAALIGPVLYLFKSETVFYNFKLSL